MSDYQLPHEQVPYLQYAESANEEIQQLLRVYRPEAAEEMIGYTLRELVRRVAREISNVYIDRQIQAANEGARENLKLIFTLNDAIKEGRIIFPTQERTS